ncbi:DUF305 domain-containing protein (plasmid) [Rhodococcus oxybenzonivorans]|uniref:DUF305 domain-containing protein n=1 Tax=Rhodococcus oxybenzonivorans TaxID=1990687 RepID=A0A2S2C7X1_9NOCA|nr:DUF305 domain-containing protein [Rhodococcus oxybenzonivorans]AWK76952.1 DUF305 domain-containing protein [Rhodococcus oxybenzonivorans]
MWSNTVKIIASVAATAGALGLAGCGGGGHDMSQMSGGDMSMSASADTAAEFNDADVMFMQSMYSHHAQAVEMAKLVQGRTENVQIAELARAIDTAQAPEMEQISSLLQDWGKPDPASNVNGMDHGTMNGMMSQEDMDSLATKNGADFDAAWLKMMIEHHTGAVDMAQTELSDGSNPEAKQLAKSIVTTQQEEIQTMQSLLPRN